MSEERPLSEFSASEEVDTEAVDETTPSGDTKPATVTYRWRSDGAVCAQCGTATEKQWRDDGEFVCPDCKRWE